jgi:hypothetical protein
VVANVVAGAFLTASLLVLQPPRANYPVWFTLAAIITIQSVATFVAMANLHAWLRIVVAAGGAALAAIGIWTVRETLTSSHFEGYAIVLGAMLVSQGGLTLVMFLRLRDFRMAG